MNTTTQNIAELIARLNGADHVTTGAEILAQHLVWAVVGMLVGGMAVLVWEAIRTMREKTPRYVPTTHEAVGTLDLANGVGQATIRADKVRQIALEAGQQRMSQLLAEQPTVTCPCGTVRPSPITERCACQK